MNITQYIPQIRKDVPIENIFPRDFFTQTRLKVFSEITVESLSEISGAILSLPNVTANPELVALAYWLRKSHLSQIEKQFHTTIHPNEFVAPCGVAFHIAPSNVDSIFLYSWCLSLLAGNINIVRISQKPTEQMMLLIYTINGVLSNAKWKPIRERNIAVTYSHDENINSYFSSHADVRITWGGDKTIRAIRDISAKPTTKELAFTDKVSFTVIDTKKLITLSDKDLLNVGKQFYNDAYWFNQKACSSPRIVFFVGTQEECNNGSWRFWDSVQKELVRREASDSASIAMNKLVFAFETVSMFGSLSLKRIGRADAPSVVHIVVDDIKKYRENCGGGFFFECFVSDLHELLPHIQPNDQTLTYFGFDKDIFRSLLESIGGNGIDRVVPIGQALAFTPVWDGYDLLTELTKRIVIQ